MSMFWRKSTDRVMDNIKYRRVDATDVVGANVEILSSTLTKCDCRVNELSRDPSLYRLITPSTKRQKLDKYPLAIIGADALLWHVDDCSDEIL
jgi:hypothetical protein